ncbi:MAG TPA: hypothetical protein VHK90_04230, partial [Thermoanaerobaculia bacterium]|nr:hypothetical protein [Thermoanaerobaculia bacterium]
MTHRRRPCFSFRHMRTLLACLLFAAFVSAQDRYRVTLHLDVDDDPDMVTHRLAAMYRLEIEPDGTGSSTVIVRGSEASIRLLRDDRRVIAVEAAPATEARPANAARNAHGFGSYTYDGAGNITQIDDDTFAYDRFGRVRNAKTGGIEQTFSYDRHGNITTISTADEADRTILVDANNRLSGATYDGAGNLLAYHGGTFVYDGLNAVKEFTTPGGNRRLYLYSA